MVHFGLETSDGQDDQEVEEVLQPRDITEERREAGHLSALLLNLFAQIEPVCRGAARLVGERYLKSGERVDVHQCYLPRL